MEIDAKLEKNIIRLAKKCEFAQYEIADKLGIKLNTVLNTMVRHGIMPLAKVEILVRNNAEKLAEELAEIANVDVKRIRELLSIYKPIYERERRIVELAMELKPQSEIAIELHTTIPTVRFVMNKNGIMSLNELRNLMKNNPGKSAEELARLARVNVDAIKNLDVAQLSQTNRDIIKLAREGKYSQTEIARVTGVSQPTVRRVILKSEIMTLEEIECLVSQNMEMSNEQLAGMAHVNVGAIEIARKKVEEKREKEKHDGEVNFKIKRTNLLQKLRNINSNITDMTAQIIVQEADVLLNEFKQYLKTEQDYALIAYAYVKAREYSKAISIGEKYIGLEESSIGALKNRIKDIMLEQEQEVNIGNNKERSTENEERFI